MPAIGDTDISVMSCAFYNSLLSLCEQIAIEQRDHAAFVLVRTFGVEACVADVRLEPQCFRLPGGIVEPLAAPDRDDDVFAALHQQDRTRADTADPLRGVHVLAPETAFTFGPERDERRKREAGLLLAARRSVHGERRAADLESSQLKEVGT